jgi:hypothetical protein
VGDRASFLSLNKIFSFEINKISSAFKEMMKLSLKNLSDIVKLTKGD